MDNTHEIKRLDNTKLVFIGKGVLIGLLAGLCVSLFRLLIEKSVYFVEKFYIYAQTSPISLIPWVIVMLF